MNNLNFKTLKKYWLRFVGIAVIAGALVLAFAWTAGLFGHRTTSKTFLGDTLKTLIPDIDVHTVKVFVLMALTIVMVRQQHSLKPLYLPSLIYQQLVDFLLEAVIRMRQIILPQQ